MPDVWARQGWQEPTVWEEYDPDRTILQLTFLPIAAIKSGDKKAAIKNGDKVENEKNWSYMQAEKGCGLRERNGKILKKSITADCAKSRGSEEGSW